MRVHWPYLGPKTCFSGLSKHRLMLWLPQPPKLALKFNCGSFKKTFVEIEFLEVTEMSSFTLIIRENNGPKMRLLTLFCDSWEQRPTSKSNLTPNLILDFWRIIFYQNDLKTFNLGGSERSRTLTKIFHRYKTRLFCLPNGENKFQ